MCTVGVSRKNVGVSGKDCRCKWQRPLRFHSFIHRSFSEFKTAYMFSLLAGPLFPFGIFFIMYAMGEVIQVPVKFLAITFLINVILMLLSSLVGNKGNMGDIQAVLFFSSDSNLAIQLLEDLPLLKEKVNENEITYLNEKASIACNLPKL